MGKHTKAVWIQTDDDGPSKKKEHEACPKCSSLAIWQGGKRYECTRCYSEFQVHEEESKDALGNIASNPLIVSMGRKKKDRLDDDGELPKGARYLDEFDEAVGATYYPGSDRIG